MSLMEQCLKTDRHRRLSADTVQTEEQKGQRIIRKEGEGGKEKTKR